MTRKLFKILPLSAVRSVCTKKCLPRKFLNEHAFRDHLKTLQTKLATPVMVLKFKMRLFSHKKMVQPSLSYTEINLEFGYRCHNISVFVAKMMEKKNNEKNNK